MATKIIYVAIHDELVHWYEISTFVFLKFQWMFSLFTSIFLSSMNGKTFIGLDYTSNTVGVLIRSINFLPFSST